MTDLRPQVPLEDQWRGLAVAAQGVLELLAADPKRDLTPLRPVLRDLCVGFQTVARRTEQDRLRRAQGRAAALALVAGLGFLLGLFLGLLGA